MGAWQMRLDREQGPDRVGGLVGIVRTLAFTLSVMSPMESFSQSSDTIRLTFQRAVC